MEGNEDSTPATKPDAACLGFRSFSSRIAERLNPRRLIAPIRRIGSKQGFPKSSKTPRAPMMVNGGLPLARSSNVPGDNSIGQNFINLVSDDEDDLDIPHNEDLESSDDEERKRHKPRLKAGHGQLNGLREDGNSKASSSNIGANISNKYAAQPGYAFNDLARQFKGDFIDEDPELAAFMLDGFKGQFKDQPLPDRIVRPYAGPVRGNGLEEDLVNLGSNEVGNKLRDSVIATVLSLFPDICQDYLNEIYKNTAQSSGRLIAHILDQTEKGRPYPKSKDKQKSLKRKRNVEDDAAAMKYGAADRPPAPVFGETRKFLRKILAVEFDETPMAFIDAVLNESRFHLFKAYRVLQEAEVVADTKVLVAYSKLKNRRLVTSEFGDVTIQAYIDNSESDRDIVEIYRELQVCRKIRAEDIAKRAAARQLILDEEANELQAKANGTMSECGCCFGDYPMNRMVHCNAETLHWFCRDCARRMAETIIGNSKYELHCMSMETCEAGFSNDQKAQFLDSKTTIALDRNEQEAMLRMAGIENLASCPFCPYAAEYPPAEINKEFHCQAPDCEKISCRLCNLESHIPKSCEEFAKENGLSVRREIEEAMSAALIRKCNKCSTPFVKEEGCNKMKCTRKGCVNVQCYICSESCGYDHFDDPKRGGKNGNCPLFDSVIERHDREVQAAEKKALEKIRAEHPEYSEGDLKINVSAEVLKDEEARKAREPAHHIAAARRIAAQGNHPQMGLPLDLGFFDAVNRAHNRIFDHPYPEDPVPDVVYGNEGNGWRNLGPLPGRPLQQQNPNHVAPLGQGRAGLPDGPLADGFVGHAGPRARLRRRAAALLVPDVRGALEQADLPKAVAPWNREGDGIPELERALHGGYDSQLHREPAQQGNVNFLNVPANLGVEARQEVNDHILQMQRVQAQQENINNLLGAQARLRARQEQAQQVINQQMLEQQRDRANAQRRGALVKNHFEQLIRAPAHLEHANVLGVGFEDPDRARRAATQQLIDNQMREQERRDRLARHLQLIELQRQEQVLVEQFIREGGPAKKRAQDQAADDAKRQQVEELRLQKRRDMLERVRAAQALQAANAARSQQNQGGPGQNRRDLVEGLRALRTANRARMAANERNVQERLQAVQATAEDVPLPLSRQSTNEGQGVNGRDGENEAPRNREPRRWDEELRQAAVAEERREEQDGNGMRGVGLGFYDIVMAEVEKERGIGEAKPGWAL